MKNRINLSLVRRLALMMTFTLSLTQGIFLQAQEAVGTQASAPSQDQTENNKSSGQSASHQLHLLEEFTVQNICRQKGMPFRTYSHFGLASDGKFYGLKNNELKTINMTESLLVRKQTEKGVKVGIQDLDPIQSIRNFMQSNGIPLSCDQAQAPEAPGRPSKKPKDSPSSNEAPAAKCNIKQGQPDTYVLAMSWQPGFCKSNNKKKKECTESEFASNARPAASNFSLHGLWPNKNSCNKNYAFCGSEKRQLPFGDYAPVEIEKSTLELLRKVMPSIDAQTSLERYEWAKHGTCQDLSANDYFTLSANLVEEFNLYPFMKKWRDSIDNNINLTEFFNDIDADLGADTSKSLTLRCKKDKNNAKIYLVEIQIPLVSTLSKTSTLRDSVDRSQSGDQGSCTRGKASATIQVVPF